MTSRHRIRPLAAFGLLLLAVGCGPSGAGFESDVSTLQVVSTNVGGKNVYVPSTLVVTSGRSWKLSIYNTTQTPHGFRIDGLGVEVLLPPGEEVSVELPPLEAGALHEAHRTATLVVLPGR
jgi:hypothetical protein